MLKQGVSGAGRGCACHGSAGRDCVCVSCTFYVCGPGSFYSACGVCGACGRDCACNGHSRVRKSLRHSRIRFQFPSRSGNFRRPAV